MKIHVKMQSCAAALVLLAQTLSCAMAQAEDNAAGTAPAAVPRRVLVLGDSLMRVPSHAIELALGRREGVTTRVFTSLGSGLARLDVFDWLVKAEALAAEFKPDAVVVWIGANDRQPMQTPAGVVQVAQPEWDAEYARRTGALMDLLLAAPHTLVYWLELPDMRDAALQKDVMHINRIAAQEAARRPRVILLETRAVLSRRPGVFSPYVIGQNGLPVQVRDTDGVHLNRAGADLIAEYLVRQLYEKGRGNLAAD